MMKTPILTIAATGVLALLGTVGCNRTDAPQPLLYPANTPVANDFNGPGAEEPNYGTRRRYVRTVSPRRESRSVEISRSRETYADRGTSSRRVVTRERPFSHSVAIVGGSAGAGAAIGALAGGGKGAGIGALAGGGAGLIYDRLTHKKKVEVQ